MGILISGLNETDCRDVIGADAWDRHLASWCTPDALLAAPPSPDHQVIWLYRAPWGSLDRNIPAGNQATLARWLKDNRAILNMRRQLAGRLTLVNADCVPKAALQARLDGQPLRGISDMVEVDAQDMSDSDVSSAQAALFGLLFERAAPQYWDVLETLEAVAWLPFSEPLVRGGMEPTEGALLALLDAVHGAPGTHAQQGARIQSMGNQDTALQEAASQHEDQQRELRPEKQALQQESELLLLQLHQVQGELEQYYLKNIDLEKASDQDRKALAITKKSLEEAVRNQKALQIQLRQMQDELKRHRVMQPPKVARSEAPDNATTPRASDGSTTDPMALTHLLPGRIRGRLNGARARKALLRQMEDLRQSDWFDAQWYLEKYPDICAAKIDPVEHYFNHGWKECRNPSTGFDTAYYLRCNPDVARSSLNPLWHFVRYGRNEGRLPREP